MPGEILGLPAETTPAVSRCNFNVYQVALKKSRNGDDELPITGGMAGCDGLSFESRQSISAGLVSFGWRWS